MSDMKGMRPAGGSVGREPVEFEDEREPLVPAEPEAGEDVRPPSGGHEPWGGGADELGVVEEADDPEE